MERELELCRGHGYATPLTRNLKVRGSNLDCFEESAVVHYGHVKSGLTIWQKATITLLLIWAVTLLIEVPYGTIFQLIPKRGVAASIGPVVLEAVFVSLMVLFIIYGLRSSIWAYLGATIIGVVHALVSAFVYFMPVGPPFAIAVYLTVLPALVGLAGAIAVIDARRTHINPRSR